MGLRSAASESYVAHRKMRRLRWGIPKYCASRTAHSIATAPDFAISSMTTPKSAPLLEVSAPGTFSQIETLGYFPLVSSLISLIILIPSWNSPDLPPSSPARFPATERSWHGLPHATTSISGEWDRMCLPVRVVMSPHLGTLGQCRPRTDWQC